MMDGRSIVQAVNHPAIIHCTLPTHTHSATSVGGRLYIIVTFSQYSLYPLATTTHLLGRTWYPEGMLDQREALHGCTPSCSQKSIHATIRQLTLPSGSFYPSRWPKEAASTSILRRQDQMNMKFGWWCSPSVCEHRRFETSKQLQKCLEGFGWTVCVSVNWCPKDTSNIFKPCVLDWYGIVHGIGV